MSYGLSNGFINASSDFAYIGFDHTNVLSVTDAGRKSVRITSLQKYNGDKLFVFNVDHMPTTSGSLQRRCVLLNIYCYYGAGVQVCDRRPSVRRVINTLLCINTLLHA
jgi:hypothetical protein